MTAVALLACVAALIVWTVVYTCRMHARRVNVRRTLRLIERYGCD